MGEVTCRRERPGSRARRGRRAARAPSPAPPPHTHRPAPCPAPAHLPAPCGSAACRSAPPCARWLGCRLRGGERSSRRAVERPPRLLRWGGGIPEPRLPPPLSLAPTCQLRDLVGLEAQALQQRGRDVGARRRHVGRVGGHHRRLLRLQRVRDALKDGHPIRRGQRLQRARGGTRGDRHLPSRLRASAGGQRHRTLHNWVGLLGSAGSSLTWSAAASRPPSVPALLAMARESALCGP